MVKKGLHLITYTDLHQNKLSFDLKFTNSLNQNNNKHWEVTLKDEQKPTKNTAEKSN